MSMSLIIEAFIVTATVPLALGVFALIFFISERIIRFVKESRP